MSVSQVVDNIVVERDALHEPWTERGGIARASASANSSEVRVDASIRFMEAHLNQPLQVSKLAALINVSPSHFFALFKRRTGRAPIDYFIRLRMERARTLLDSTTYSVKEVAVQLGYDDPFYFSRVFKSVHRVSPSHYRRARQGGGDHRDEDGDGRTGSVRGPALPFGLGVGHGLVGAAGAR